MEASEDSYEWEGCQARILQPFDFAHTEPRGRHCSLAPDNELCGVRLCTRHREMLTTWVGGRETLLDRKAAREFATWGVTPTKPFEPQPD